MIKMKVRVGIRLSITMAAVLAAGAAHAQIGASIDSNVLPEIVRQVQMSQASLQKSGSVAMSAADVNPAILAQLVKINESLQRLLELEQQQAAERVVQRLGTNGSPTGVPVD